MITGDDKIIIIVWMNTSLFVIIFLILRKIIGDKRLKIDKTKFKISALSFPK
jgi:hypothetical protein